VVCQWTQNLDQFPWKKVSSLEHPPKTRSLPEKILDRLGLDQETRTRQELLDEVIRSVKPDIIHSHFGNNGWAACAVALKHKVRHVVSFYGQDASYLPYTDSRWFSRYRYMSDRVDLVLCEGPHMAESIAKLGVAPGKISVFRLGIALNRFPFVPRENDRNRPKRFLIAGSFREKKGIPHALEALGILAQRHPEMTITIIGDSGGSQREQIERGKIFKTVERFDLQSRTRFLGYRPYEFLIEQFYQHDVFVSPSVTSCDGDTEGGAPVTIIEAAASGMPVVSTFHCDIPFVLSERNRAFLAPERNPVALAAKIQQLIDTAEWGPIVSANRQLIDRELNVTSQGIKLAKIYTDMLSRGTGDMRCVDSAGNSELHRLYSRDH
jgi:colanic acid/amylovoran biosynthesis glycosyltransferase